jgi:hypothetical protein
MGKTVIMQISEVMFFLSFSYFTQKYMFLPADKTYIGKNLILICHSPIKIGFLFS